MREYLRSDNDIFRSEDIINIDCTEIDELKIIIHLKTGKRLIATNIHAIEIIMCISPSIFEGRKLKWVKNAWIVHNLLGHPLMQIFAFFRMYKTAFWVHDITIPRPKPE